jgi:transposase
MRTVDDFAGIRRLHRNHLSGRKIALQLGVGRDTVRKALANPEPVPYTLKKHDPLPSSEPSV